MVEPPRTDYFARGIELWNEICEGRDLINVNEVSKIYRNTLADRKKRTGGKKVKVPLVDSGNTITMNEYYQIKKADTASLRVINPMIIRAPEEYLAQMNPFINLVE